MQERGDDIAVTLDKMALKTPEGNILLLPAHKKLVATLVASEWEHQETVIKHHALPVVRSRRSPTHALLMMHVTDIDSVSSS